MKSSQTDRHYALTPSTGLRGACLTRRPRLRPFVGTVVAVLTVLLATEARAYVSYVQEMQIPSGHTVYISTSGAPQVGSAFKRVLTTTQRYNFNTTTGASGLPLTLPGGLGISQTSLAAIGPDNTMLFFVTQTGLFTPYSLTTLLVDSFIIEVQAVYSVAAYDNTHVTIMFRDSGGTDGGYTVDLTNEAVEKVFWFVTGSGNGEFNTARFHAYGPDGLLYVLDYGNSRVQVLDPNNAYAYVRQFPFQAGTTTANKQFGIGPNGNIYLSDGLGGGASYSSTGTFVNSFSPPAGLSAGSGPGGEIFMSSDLDGHVYGHNGNRIHQFVDGDPPTPTPTSTPTSTPTLTATETATLTPTSTQTSTATETATETATHTPTATPTDTSTATPTQTATDTATQTATRTATQTPTATATSTTSLSAFCPPSPDSCEASLKGNLAIKNGDPHSKDKLTWKLAKGPAAGPSDFGNPLDDTSYAFCVYDDGVLKLQAHVGPSALLWKAASTKGFKYKDRDLSSEGIGSVQLLGGAAEKTKLQVAGKGEGLDIPAPQSPTKFFAATTSVTVQLYVHHGRCFQTVFTSGQVKKNEPGGFSAKF